MSETPEERQILVQRIIPFARDLIWKAMTEENHANAWWGPDGFRNTNSKMDFRVGGSWEYDMIGPDGKQWPNRMDFKEIVVPSKIVFDHGDRENVWFETTVTLDEVDSGTRVTILQTYPTREDKEKVEKLAGASEGGKQHLANLENYVKENLA